MSNDITRWTENDLRASVSGRPRGWVLMDSKGGILSIPRLGYDLYPPRIVSANLAMARRDHPDAVAFDFEPAQHMTPDDVCAAVARRHGCAMERRPKVNFWRCSGCGAETTAGSDAEGFEFRAAFEVGARKSGMFHRCGSRCKSMYGVLGADEKIEQN